MSDDPKTNPNPGPAGAPADAEAPQPNGHVDDLAQARRQRDDYHDQLQRTRAEFANYQKRAKAQADANQAYAVGGLALDLLAVLDNFERAMDAAQSSQNADALHEGISLIYKQLQEALTKAGVEPIVAVGQPFDPTQHEAIMQVEAGNGHEPNTVVEELRRGYRLHDRVIRASLVKVAA